MSVGLMDLDPQLYDGLGPEEEVGVDDVTDEAELEEIINSTLERLGFDDMVTQNAHRLQSKMRSIDRKYREVNRIFTDCHDMLNKSGKDHHTVVANSLIPETIVCGSDSDDDLQVIDFEPSGSTLPVTKHSGPKSPASADSTKPVHLIKHPLAPMPPPSAIRRTKSQMSIESDDTNVSMKVADMLPQQPTQMLSLLTQQTGNAQSKPVQSMHPKSLDLAIGMKLFAKKFNEIWYKGTLIDVQNKDAPRTHRRYKVKYDGKGMKIVSGKNLAHHDHPKEILPVGSRVIAMYKDDEDIANSCSFFAGIVAEPPSVRNNHRYLTFFDDGYAQYCTSQDLHKVYEQSKNVWDDIHPDSQEFIKGYLQQYPERPMVRLQKGQVVKTEWNGRWWVARVQEVDASLVKMHFEADRRVEWIYRGSTRLEPLYTELANAEASKLAGKGRRHNLNMKSNRKPIVEYTRGTDRLEDESKKQAALRQTSAESIPTPVVAQGTTSPEKPVSVTDPQKKRSVARKSTGNRSAAAPAKPAESPEGASVQASQWWEKKTLPPKPAVQKERTSEVIDLDSEEALGERVGIRNILPKRDRKPFETHLCGNHCIKELELEKDKLKCNNPLLFPQLCGWERQITKQKNTSKRVMFYRAPCGRRMRDLEETDYFLMMTNSMLSIDYFCFDPNLHTDTEYVPVKTFCDIKDLSYGKENVPISCVNGIDRQYPDYVEYSNRRIPAKGVKLNLDTEFLSGCDCTDGCRDPTKCACIQMTLAASKAIPGLSKENPEELGYEFRRLKEPLISGIYECNSRCKCDHRCMNRVAQNGLQLRLQVFKTEKRGWGLRCLDDIPAGGFICVYAGQLLTEQGANEDGQTFGDEYLAELDYIEVVERTKEGYESDVNEDEGIASEKEDTDEEYKAAESDSTYSGERRYKKRSKPSGRRPSRKAEEDDDRIGKIVLKRESASGIEKAWSVKSVKESMENKEVSGKQKAQDWLDSLSLQDDAIVISDEEDGQSRNRRKIKKPPPNEGRDSKGESSSGKSDTLPDLELSDKEHGTTAMEQLRITDPTSLNTDDIELEDSDEDNGVTTEKKPGVPTMTASGKLRRSTRSTTNTSRFRNLPDPKSQKPVSPLKINLSSMQVTKKEEKQAKNKMERRSTRDTRCLFGEEFCYVMDAKSMGNLGRYLNHSCSPNVFVQNVFVDTHDLRFPWVAFFAYQYVRAGTELTWDYNYEVGSVPGKILYCYCGSAECRGRLL